MKLLYPILILIALPFRFLGILLEKPLNYFFNKVFTYDMGWREALLQNQVESRLKDKRFVDQLIIGVVAAIVGAIVGAFVVMLLK